MSEELFDKYLNDSLTEQEADELHSLLQDPSKGEELVTYTVETRLIADMAQKHQSSTVKKDPKLKRRKKSKLKPLLFMSAIAASLYFFLNLTPDIFLENESDFEKVSGSLVSNIRETSVLFEGDSLLALKRTDLFLNDGSSLAFEEGAKVTFESLAGTTKVKLEEGRVRFKVKPQKEKFIVNLKEFDIEVVGTEFIVEVSDGSNSVEMIEGTVNVIKGSKKIILSDSNVLVYRNGGTFYTGSPQSITYYKWASWSEFFGRSPGTSLYLDMNGDLRAQNSSIQTKLLKGEFTHGRIHMKKSLLNGAVEVVKSKDFILGDEYTVFAWLNYSKSDYYSPIITKGETSMRLQLHEGRAHIGYGENSLHEFFTAGDTLTPNEWHFVAATIGSDRVKLFVDGKLVGEKELKRKIPENKNKIMIGDSEAAKGREFLGRIGEVGIFSKAYSEDEVRNLFLQSNLREK